MPSYPTKKPSNGLYRLFPIILLLLSQTGLAQTNDSTDNSIWYSSGDPLKTEALTPPAIPAGYLDESRGNPCSALDYNSALGLADVADAALCNNPQTREAWANARIQAAQVGIARSAYLPSVNDSVSANLNVAHPESSSNNPYSN